MTAAEEGILLLCCCLGDPESRPLTIHQFRELGLRIRAAAMTGDPLRQMTPSDLTALGYAQEQADRILRLLDRETQLRRYLSIGESAGIAPITRISDRYPRRFSAQKGNFCPSVLFYRGNPALLNRPAIAVVGSRALHPENEAFARRAGRFAAQEGLVLVSGGAAGADQTAQKACLEAGGSCVIFLPDRLDRISGRERTLYVSADGYDLPFSTPRALRRNALIHILGEKTIAAQCTHGTGGTWQGCTENLKHKWSDLYVFDDGSAGTAALMTQGAAGLSAEFTGADLNNSQLTIWP